MTTSGFRYTCSHDMRAENPLHQRLLQLWDRVRERSGGELVVETAPWGGAGPSKQSLDKLLGGELAFHPISGMPLSTIVPLAAMEGFPFAYRSEQEALRVLDGPFGDLLRREIARKGIVIFPKVWHQGFNQITSRGRAIRDVEDLRGFRLRTAQVPYKVDLFSALGCDPQQIHYQAVYAALESGAADGQETPYLYIEMDRAVEVQTHLNVTNHRFAAFWMCANPQRWEALPESVRTIVEEELDRHVALYRADMVAANAAACERLKGRLEFVATDTDSMVRKLVDSGFYRRWRERWGEEAWQSLQAERGREALP
jgi:TRAP-type transport system periplasmic protein